MLTRVAVLVVLFGITVPAAVISLSAQCPEIGVTSLNTPIASCEGPLTSAMATAGGSGPDYNISISAIFKGPDGPYSYLARAGATLDANYVVTATGGTGTVNFRPCLSITESGLTDPNSGVTAEASFGSTSEALFSQGNFSSGRTCNFSAGLTAPITLTFGIAQTFQLHLSARAYGINGGSRGGSGTADLSFSGGRLVDIDGFTLPGSLSIVETNTPEPSTAAFLALGGIFIVLKRRLAVRYR